MSVTRRLAAILAADVVGFSRLMEADEAGTLAALKSRRRDVLDPLVAKYQGRLFKVTGDSALVEFASAVNAVQCAVDLQQAFAAANTELPDERHLILRIGVNLGDVMVEDGDLYGDGINIAARLESLADPGGILVSGTAYDYVRNKVKVGFDDLGPQILKNIAEPVRAYRVTGTPAVTAAAPKASADKPSIAVLPFANMSGDPEQEYVADGITENITTGLSRFRDLMVIARNSSFAYKGKAIKVQDISRELGARFILEGSLQRRTDRIRITAQLIDGATGRHLWAESYDRSIADIFTVLDEVTETIIGTLASGYGGRVRKAWRSQRAQAGPHSLQAFDFFERGLECAERFSKDDNVQSRIHLQKAIELDPHYGKAIAKLAWSYTLDIVYGWGGKPSECWPRALELAKQAIAVDDDESWGHWALAGYCRFHRQFDQAEREYRKAIELNSNDADVMADFAYLLTLTGRAKEAIENMLRAMRLNPHYPSWYTAGLAHAYYECQMFDAAVQILESPEGADTALSLLFLAASHAALENTVAAAAAIKRVLDVDPGATISKWATLERIAYQHESDLQKLRSHLHQAGLPE